MLEVDNRERIRETAELRAAAQSLPSGVPKQDELQLDNKLLKQYTGLSNFTTFIAVLDLVSSSIPHHSVMKLSNYQCFMLTLMRLRLDLPYFDLEYRFGVSQQTASRIFIKWIGVMAKRLSFLIIWPDRESLQKTMPFCFLIHYGLKVVSVIDCFEIFI